MTDTPRPTPLIYAHRGARLDAPENTLPAFARAIELGADGIELDVHLTSDGVPVVLHDGLLTVYTSSYRDVWGIPLRALQTLDASQGFADFAGVHIPTLRDVLTLLAPHRIRINIELKAQPHWRVGLEAAVVALVREFGLEHRTLLSSFNPLILWRLFRLAPDIPRGYLLDARGFPFLHLQVFARLIHVTHVNPHIDLLTPKFITAAARRHWPLAVWTVNTPVALHHAHDAGASIVITDDPALARDVYRGGHAV